MKMMNLKILMSKFQSLSSFFFLNFRVIGKIVQRGEKVPQDFQLDLVVGVGWHAGHCLECENCRLGDFGSCVKLTGFPTATGLSRDGGMAEYMSARWDALVMIPKELAARPAETAPLLCAGVTVFTAITEAGLKPGDVVLVQGNSFFFFLNLIKRKGRKEGKQTNEMI